MKPNPIFKWSLIVFAFWWFIFTFLSNAIFPLVFEGWKHSVDKPAMAFQFRIWSIGIGLGIVGVIGGSLWIRNVRSKRLGGKGIRGMRSMLGKVPLIQDWFSAHALARKEAVELDGADTQEINAWKKWRSEHKAKYPAHVALADVLMQMYDAKKELPATHHSQGHGAKSLGAHCLSVAVGMLRAAPSFKYVGLQSRRGKIIAQMQRADGIDLSEHPLVFIAGLAHDLGKMEAYVLKEGKVIGCAKEHDLLSARMLGRLEETWKLPHKEREALLAAVGYYHHPMSFPLDNQGRVSDDLGAGLMLLLNRCDIEVSGMELEEEYDKPEIEDLTIYEAFVDVVSEVNRINGSDPVYVVGQKWKDLIILKEPDLRRAVAEKLLIPDSETNEGGFVLTQKICAELRSRGLMATSEDVQKAEFKRGSSEAWATWNNAIAIRPGKILPGLTGMQDYDGTATAVLSANQNRNMLVDSDVNTLRREVASGNTGDKEKIPVGPAAGAVSTDDDFDIYGLSQEEIAAKLQEKEAREMSQAQLAPAPAPVAAAVVEEPAKEAETVSEPVKEPVVPVADTTEATKPVKSPGTDVAASGMKDLSSLISAAAKTREKKSTSRLDETYGELLSEWGADSAAPASTEAGIEETTPVSVAPPEPVVEVEVAADVTPEPSIEAQPDTVIRIPRALLNLVTQKKIEFRERESGVTVVIIPENFSHGEMKKWVDGLPEGKDANPASCLVSNGKKLIILQKGWQEFVGP